MVNENEPHRDRHDQGCEPLCNKKGCKRALSNDWGHIACGAVHWVFDSSLKRVLRTYLIASSYKDAGGLANVHVHGAKLCWLDLFYYVHPF